METRRFGRTGHANTVAVFGAFPLSNLEQARADQVMEQLTLDESRQEALNATGTTYEPPFT